MLVFARGCSSAHLYVGALWGAGAPKTPANGSPALSNPPPLRQMHLAESPAPANYPEKLFSHSFLPLNLMVSDIPGNEVWAL